MHNNQTEIIEESSIYNWDIYIISENKKLLDSFNKIEGNSHHNISLHFLTNGQISDQDICNFNINSIIHFDCGIQKLEQLQRSIERIRKSEKCENAYITVWHNKDYKDFSLNIISENRVNDIRIITDTSIKIVPHIVAANIESQQKIIELVTLKGNLNSTIEERTASLTRLNKKLQSFVIQNSNINTKLHQQKNQIEKQNTEIQAHHKDLEKAFKKSSRQHIKLHKVMLENEEQRNELEKALSEIQEINLNLKQKNKEIDQQREEIRAQRDMAIQQHDLIQTHQSEINENITYARRIQNAMLTPEHILKQLIPQHFVLNKPKDIVSGDFFWVGQNERHTVIAVADCTGHGISGAMMSMLGIAFLNEIVNNNSVIKSDEILEQLRSRIIHSLHQEYSHDISFSRDGMDISIAVIDIVEQRLEYSGANNPIYIIRNGELLELKPDKMPIGIHEFFEESFSSKMIELSLNDIVYMFSDGYADQFGGVRGKKLKYKKFKNLIQKASSSSMDQQREFLSTEFDNWKGDFEQIDDVLILGYKFLG